jgi:predicted PurR-regulated permease PerM
MAALLFSSGSANQLRGGANGSAQRPAERFRPVTGWTIDPIEEPAILPVPPRRRAIVFHAFTPGMAVIGIFLILLFVTMHEAAYFFAPLLSALVIGLLVSPLASRLERRGAPPALAASVLLIGALAGVGFVIFGLVRPLQSWVERAPALWREIRQMLRGLEAPLRDVTQMRDQVRDLIGGGGDVGAVVVQAGADQSIGVMTAAPALAGQLLLFICAFYFFLAGRRDLKRSLVGIYTARADQVRVGRLVAAIEHAVSHYLAAVAMINLAFGVVIGCAMWLFDLPEPLLWGALAFGLNFIPYLGPAILTLLIFSAGLLSFYDISTPLFAALTYLGLNMLEGQFITPSIIGKQSTVNPMLVFFALAFGLWFWGAVGAFLAMPVLLIIRAVAVHSRAQGMADAPPGPPLRHWTAPLRPSEAADRQAAWV